MITVTRLNKETFLVNQDLIEFIEETPDTVVSMQSGRKLVVIETAAEIEKAIMDYRRSICMQNVQR